MQETTSKFSVCLSISLSVCRLDVPGPNGVPGEARERTPGPRAAVSDGERSQGESRAVRSPAPGEAPASSLPTMHLHDVA